MRVQSIKVEFDNDEDMRDIVFQLWQDGYTGSVLNMTTIEVFADNKLDIECVLDMLASKELAKRL